MNLADQFNKSGNWLFKHRGNLPLILFVLGAIVELVDRQDIVEYQELYWGAICFGISMLGLILRIIIASFVPKGTSGRNTQQQVADSLNTKGIYSVSRHPLYLGNLFMWLGCILFFGNIWFVIVVALIFWVYYERIIYAEEHFLKEKFGKEYNDYADRTPAFIPKIWLWQKSDSRFSIKKVLKKEYYGFYATVLTFVFIDLLKNFVHQDEFWLDYHWQIVLIAGSAIFVILFAVNRIFKLLENVE